MKKKGFLVCFVTILFISFFAATAFSANTATVGLRPVDSSILTSDGYIEVPVCTTFEVELYFEGLNDNLTLNNGLVAMGVSVDWDPLVSLEGFAKGAWPNMALTDKTPDYVDIYADVPVNVDPIFTDHIIGTFMLHCIGEGWTDLMPRGTLDAPYNFALSDFNYLDHSILFEGVRIHQVVPIPGAIFLFGSSVLGLFGIRRKIKNLFLV